MLGNRIAEILEHQGRTMTWLAKRTGYSRWHVNRVVNGAEPPSPRFRAECARALDIPEHLLFFEKDCPSNQDGQAGERRTSDGTQAPARRTVRRGAAG
ncbi:MAG: helix-turn-helix transcriptional regulator [Chloroflexi bacterium]|nr:helix-turn-helix transcriptional regulator [Chloroflexota bacterium]